MTWTDEEVKKLKQLTRTHTTQRIADELGKPFSEVRYQIRKHSLKTKPANERSFKDARKIFDHSEKYGCRLTAGEFGLSIDAVKSIRRSYKKKTLARNEEHSGDKLQKYWQQARYYANQMGWPHYSQDFASYVVIQKITNPERKLQFKHLLIDFMRQEFGEMRTESGKAEAFANHTSVAIGHENPDGSIIDIPDKPADDWFKELIAVITEKDFTERERACFLLVAWSGFSQREVAIIFGVTESMIAHHIYSIHKKIRGEDG